MPAAFTTPGGIDALTIIGDEVYIYTSSANGRAIVNITTCTVRKKLPVFKKNNRN